MAAFQTSTTDMTENLKFQNIQISMSKEWISEDNFLESNWTKTEPDFHYQ